METYSSTAPIICNWARPENRVSDLLACTRNTGMTAANWYLWRTKITLFRIEVHALFLPLDAQLLIIDHVVNSTHIGATESDSSRGVRQQTIHSHFQSSPRRWISRRCTGNWVTALINRCHCKFHILPSFQDRVQKLQWPSIDEVYHSIIALG